MTTTEDATRTGCTAATDPFAASLESMRSALASVSDVPAWTLSEEAVQARLGETLRVRAQVEELTARLLATVRDREVPRLGGASSPRAWLMATHGISGPDAARLVKETAVHTSADDLSVDASDRVGLIRAAWSLGQVNAEQALLIGRTIAKLSGDVSLVAAARLQQDLVGHAQRLSYDGLRKVCRHVLEVVDPDGAEARLADALEREENRTLAGAELTFRRSGDGWSGFSGRLPDSYADLWKKSLDAYTNPRHRAAGGEQLTLQTDGLPAGWDQAGPGCPRGADLSTGDPARGVDGADPKTMPYQQRLGRAWCEPLEHLPVDGLPKHGANTTTLIVTISLDQLRSGVGEAILDTGTAMSPGQVRRLACNAAIIPIVLDGKSTVLDLGMARRLFDRYQRLALAVRDQGCIWPGCDKPPVWCEAHHLTSWVDGGPTDLANGCLLCPFHHHLVHGSEGWRVVMAPDGIPEVIPPLRLDPSQTTRRHERFSVQRC